MSEPAVDSGGASLARASGALLAARIVGAAGFFVAAVITARSLGASGRGTLAFVTVVALLVARLASFGIGGATVYFAARRPAERARRDWLGSPTLPSQCAIQRQVQFTLVDRQQERSSSTTSTARSRRATCSDSLIPTPSARLVSYWGE